MPGNVTSIEFIQLSSLEKVMLSKRPTGAEYTRMSALKNEPVSYQIAYLKKECGKKDVRITIESPLKKYITVREVRNVPVQLPIYPAVDDDDYLIKEPGLMPDVLIPLSSAETQLFAGAWYSLWVTVEADEERPVGKHDIAIKFFYDDICVTKTMQLEIVDVSLPEQRLIFTQWLHADCIASYYNVEIFSEAHWRYIEEFVKVAVKNGINMLLTPVFTPPLDTKVGGERPTVQLVSVRRNDNGYTFNFSKLERWIDMCQKNGIKYFEISHLFTQWGAKCAPKIVAEENGKVRQIFGWDTPSDSTEYTKFLNCFLPQLTDFLRKRGIAENTMFHISDEPHGEEAKANYKRSKDIIKKHLKGFRIIDALSDVVFYKEGIVDNPIPSIEYAKAFIDAGVHERWTYYCCAQDTKVSNRFIAMPSYRNRIVAEQLFKFDIKGFLHWGYNFYYSQYSIEKINPYAVTDAVNAFPSGDAFSVYPYKDGTAESLRLIVFADALRDMRAMELLAGFIGRGAVVKLIEETAGMAIEFDSYPRSAEYILRRRELINRKIAELV